AHNLSHMTMKAVVSGLGQDIGNVRVMLINQGSTDGLAQAAEALYPDVVTTRHYPPLPSLAAAWNLGLSHLLEGDGGKVLVVNNDVELIPETYRLLAKDGGGFVTAVGVTPTTEKPFDATVGDLSKSRPHPDFSASSSAGGCGRRSAHLMSAISSPFVRMQIITSGCTGLG
ncbi:hypothetical protein LCGC14_1465170, partial [marine sediment metagenome]